MTSNPPHAPPPYQEAPTSGYQIGEGAPVDQNYLQPQDSTQAAASIEAPQHLQYPPPPMGASDPQPPPPASQYNLGGLDVNAHSGQQYGPSPQAAPAGQDSKQYYPPPPAQNPSGAPPGYGQPPQSHTPPQQPNQPQSIPPPSVGSGQQLQQYSQSPGTLTSTAASGAYPVPPRRQSANYGEDDPSSPIHYTRNPHKLVAYLVPFPKPVIKGVEASAIPDRFLIYTPPPPPLLAPKEREKEDKLHKVQRKWQEEVRAAKTGDAKTASWKGVKSKATVGISWVMSKTTTSNLDFVNRIPGAKADPKDKHSDDGVQEGNTTHKTVGLEEMILVYPQSYNTPPDQVKNEFINTMMRTKSKAQRDAIIATGLLPVSGAIDLLATLVWPFGGLLEVDSVWAYSSIRGAKTARSVTKRLSSSTHSGNTHAQTEEEEMAGDKLRLTFTQSSRLEILQRYLVTRCRDVDHKHFPSTAVVPTETDVLSAIGWAPSQTDNVSKNWEDEQWETDEVKEDMRSTLGKAAKEWDNWCKAFAKDPNKALKK